MPTCTRKGCAAQFSDYNNEDLCTFHPGAPVFHEGLKSWSCCQDVNKPVLDFDSFMKIPGCEEIRGHTIEVKAPQAAAEPSASAPTPPVASAVDADGKEHYQTNGVSSTEQKTPQSVAPATEAVLPKIEPVLEEDDLTVSVDPGTVCRRKGCGVVFESEDVNRIGDGEGTVCHFHPLPPFFREGSKGYLCCKRRVLEFDEFLKIKGCKTGRHVFAPIVTEPQAEEQVVCRIDHYQTQPKVFVSVFAKQVDKERSTVTFESDKLHLDLYLPQKKRFTKSIELFGPIDSDTSTFQILGTKVEIQLQKSDGRSWTILEKPDRDLGGVALTFGVSGRTGTVGGKEIMLDDNNKARLG